MSYTVNLDNYFGVGPVTAVDLSCGAVSSSLLSVVATVYDNYGPWQVTSCSQTPLQVGSIVYTTYNGGQIAAYSVTSISGDAGSPVATSWQDAIAAQNVLISTLETKFETLQTTIGSNGVDPDAVAAGGVVFMAILGALCMVWGVKQIMRIFSSRPGDE